MSEGRSQRRTSITSSGYWETERATGEICNPSKTLLIRSFFVVRVYPFIYECPSASRAAKLASAPNETRVERE